MTKTLFKRGGKKRIQGHLVLRIDCAEDRVEELCDAGWAKSPREAYAPKTVPLPKPIPKEKIYEPDTGESYLPKPKKKKSRKKG